MDIATLGIAIDSRQAATAKSDLDELTAAAGRTEQAAQRTGAAYQKSSQTMASTSKSISDSAAKASTSFDQIGKKVDAATNSLKQNQQALRQVPIQFTDIAVGLSTGQSPMMVLLQQGGQLKDMFGGIGPAARAMGGYVAGLVGPFTLAAGAAGVLALAYKQGSDEQTAFTHAIVESGNVAGVTTQQLAGMAAQIDEQVGTTRQAAAALSMLVGTGRIYGDQLQQLAQSVVAWERATGTAVEDTVKQFAELAKDPVAASLKLNEAYHYLTLSTFEQIRALQAQGLEREAAALAEKTYATALDDRAKEIEKSLGYIEGAWKKVKSGAAEAWDAILGVGRESDFEAQLNKLYFLMQFDANAATKAGLQKQIEDIETQRILQQGNAAMWAEERRVQDDGIAAESRIASIRDSMLTNAERREKAILEIRQSYDKIRAASPDSPLLRDGSEGRLIEGARERYKDKDPGLTLDNIGAKNRELFDEMARKGVESSSIMREVARANEEYFDGIGNSLNKLRAGRDEVLELLMTDEERLRASYDRRQAMLDRSHESGIISETAYLEATQKLREKYEEDALAASDSYWDRYLAAAEKNLTSFDELTGNTIERFSNGFGDAFEKVIFDAETAGDAFKGLMEGVARATVNALGQMAAQWLAYQAVQLLTSRAAAQAAAAPAIAEAEAKSASAQIGAFNAVVGIPYVGPVLAPVAAAAAAAFTSPLVQQVASSFAGMAHSGMSNIPREGTWLLDGGERVIAPQQNRDLTAFLSNQRGGGGDTFHISVSAVDARSMDRLIQRSGDSVARALSTSVRDFRRPKR